MVIVLVSKWKPRLKNGQYDESMCGLDRNEYKKKYREQHREEINTYFRNYRSKG